MNPQSQPTTLSETLTERQKWLLLGSLMVSLFVGALDQTVVSTAVPRIVADLNGFAMLSWLFTSYMLSSTVIIPLVGKLGDVFGRKLFLIGGVFIFMVASAACGAAQDMTQLVWFRAVQGLGGGMIFASVFATLGDIFPPAERGKYIGFFTGTFSLASLLGPTLGGLLTDNGGWRLVFYINIPVSLIAMPAIYFNLPSRQLHRRPKIDFIGATLLSIASVSLLLAMVWAGEKYAWSSAQVLGLIVVAAIGVALFIVQERRHPEPILPLHLFKNRIFLFSNIIVFAFGLGVFGAFQYLGLFVQTALGKSATASGIISTPQSIGVLVASVLGGQVMARTGKYKIQTVSGAVLISVSMVFLRTLAPDTAVWSIMAAMVVLGIGFGLVLPSMSLIVQNAVSYEYLGVASSSGQFFRQIGSVLGIAIFGAILTNVYSSEFQSQFSGADRQVTEEVVVKEKTKDVTVAEILENPASRRAADYPLAQAQMAKVPEGSAILKRAEAAQAESVAAAVRNIFTGALVAALVCVAFTLIMKELPLRRTVQTGSGGPGPSPAAAIPDAGH